MFVGAHGRGWASRLLALTPLLLVACHYARSEVVVHVVTDIDRGPGATLRAVLVDVKSDSATGAERMRTVVPLTAAGAGLGELFTFGVSPLGGDTSRTVYVELRGCGDVGCEDPTRTVVTQRALFSFVAGEARALTMLLADRCRSAACTTSQRCAPESGQCVGARVDVWSLPPASAVDSGATRDDATSDGGTEVGADVSDVPDEALDASDAQVDIDAEVFDAADAADATDDAPTDAPDAEDASVDGSDASVDGSDAQDVSDSSIADASSCMDGGAACGGACVDLASDSHNCGACGVACPVVVGALSVCVRGACGFACIAGLGDCDGIAANGCETNLNASATHCGACGNGCAFAHASGSCVVGACAIGACSVGFDDCDGRAVNGCEAELATSVANCGSCGTRCSFPNASASCVGGACALGECAPGFGNCNGSAVDGCETNLTTSLTNCGVCGTRCSFANASAVCAEGMCALGTCNAGFGDCDRDLTNGCETNLNVTAANCGACGNACSLSNAIAGCSSGACVLTSCNAGFDNCDGVTSNGCETNLQSSSANCGSCGHACGAGNVCTSGTCALGCVTGQTDCSGTCAYLTTDVANCGACGHACVFPHATPSCASGACRIAACNTGFSDCNRTFADGCEANLQTDAANCGVCSIACSFANAAASCVAGACALGVCATGYGNCDGAAATGCETNLNTSTTHCGVCGRACTAPANGSVACVSGTCTTTCNAGYALSGTTCSIVPAPRPIAPLSTATVTSQRPTLRWALTGIADGARVQICRDRACGTVEHTLDVTGTSAAPPTSLSAGVHFWRLAGRRGSVAGTALGPTWEFFVGARSAPRDTSWGTVPDFNGDGYADVVVGADRYSSATGRAYVYYGSAGGLPTAPNVRLTGPDGANGYFGNVVASAGDVNGDGFADLVVSTYQYSGVTGRAYVYYGSAAGLPATASVTLNAQDGTNTRFGISAASAGDINSDGYADLAVGADRYSGGVGRVYFYHGGAGGLPATSSFTLTGAGGSSFGSSVAGLGDINGDGFADVIVGAPGIGIYVYYGTGIGLPTTASLSLTERALSVAGALDVNGDGLADFANTDSYGINVHLGTAVELPTPPNYTLPTSDSGNCSTLTFVANVGDANGDGYDELATSCPNYASYGRVYIYQGGVAGLPTVPTRGLTGFISSSSTFGRSMAGTGDVNGDGFADFTIGFSGYVGQVGRVYVYHGARTGLPELPTLTLDNPLGTPDQFGISVAIVGYDAPLLAPSSRSTDALLRALLRPSSHRSFVSYL